MRPVLALKLSTKSDNVSCLSFDRVSPDADTYGRSGDPGVSPNFGIRDLNPIFGIGLLVRDSGCGILDWQGSSGFGTRVGLGLVQG